jgi:cell division protein FtsQ
MDIRKGKYIVSPFQYVSYLSKLAALGLVVFSIVHLSSKIELSQSFPIKIVRVYGANRVDQEEIKSLLLPLIAKGFFGVQVGFIKDKLIQIPWVSNIFVRRAWPDQLEIMIIEKDAVARWNHQHLLSKAGELFAPKKETYPSYIPEFVGPQGKQIFMLQYFIEMNRLLMPLHAKISYLELTPYLTWQLTLDNGIVLQLGHKDILTRLSHFVKVYPQIIGMNAKEVDYVDLRYPNGLAIRWKSREHLHNLIRF